MVTTELFAVSVSLVLLSVVCIAIWNTHYPDTLTQRLGLVLTALGCIFVAHAAIFGTLTVPPLLWTLFGVSVFAVGTLLKRVRQHRLEGVVR